MKRIIAIALALMAFTSFGSQQTQVAEARARHIREVQRARVERIKREGERAERAERANIYHQVSAEASERNIKANAELIRRWYEQNVKTPFNCHQAPVEVKKKKPRNSLMSYDTRRENNRFERTAPARRRK